MSSRLTTDRPAHLEPRHEVAGLDEPNEPAIPVVAHRGRASSEAKHEMISNEVTPSGARSSVAARPSEFGVSMRHAARPSAQRLRRRHERCHHHSPASSPRRARTARGVPPPRTSRGDTCTTWDTRSPATRAASTKPPSVARRRRCARLVRRVGELRRYRARPTQPRMSPSKVMHGAFVLVVRGCAVLARM